MFFFLPYGNDRRNTSYPVVTYSLLAGNLAVFLVLISIPREAIVSQFGLFASRPWIITIFTSMFVHANPLHLAWNLFFLWLFGPNVEDVLGRTKFAALYIVSGIVAALLHIWVVRSFIPFGSDIPVVGASGAIAGILGVFAVRFYRTGIKVFWYIGILFYPLKWGTFTVSAIVGLGIWFTQQLAGGILGVINPLLTPRTAYYWGLILPEGVAYWSHIGGMAFGVILAYLVGMHHTGKREYLWKDANYSLEQGTTWHAASNFCALLECDPGNPDVHASLGKTYALQQDVELAVAHYQKSIEIYLENSIFDRAVDAFLELKSFYRNARLDLKSEMQLARCLSEMGEYDSSLNLFMDIVASYPETPEAEVALIKAADMYHHVYENLPEAVRHYEMFLEKYPFSSLRASVIRSLANEQPK